MSTLPSLNSDRTTSGIYTDPRTKERVVPETRRADGSIRKELKIRPGFTPQEDVGRFRGKRQIIAEANKLSPKHVPGWTPAAQPSSSRPTVQSASAPVSKATLKNAKRKQKRKEQRETAVPEAWDDEEDGANPAGSADDAASTQPNGATSVGAKKAASGMSESEGGGDAANSLTAQLGDLSVS